MTYRICIQRIALPITRTGIDLLTFTYCELFYAGTVLKAMLVWWKFVNCNVCQNFPSVSKRTIVLGISDLKNTLRIVHVFWKFQGACHFVLMLFPCFSSHRILFFVLRKQRCQELVPYKSANGRNLEKPSLNQQVKHINTMIH